VISFWIKFFLDIRLTFGYGLCNLEYTRIIQSIRFSQILEYNFFKICFGLYNLKAIRGFGNRF